MSGLNWLGAVALCCVTGVAGAEEAPAASAEEAMKLAAQNNCMACHALDKKIVGPAFRDVAEKYRGRADAEAVLIDKVARGGKGVWGKMPMPAMSPNVKDEDIAAIVRHILSLKG